MIHGGKKWVIVSVVACNRPSTSLGGYRGTRFTCMFKRQIAALSLPFMKRETWLVIPVFPVQKVCCYSRFQHSKWSFNPYQSWICRPAQAVVSTFKKRHRANTSPQRGIAHVCMWSMVHTYQHALAHTSLLCLVKLSRSLWETVILSYHWQQREVIRVC